MFEKEAEEYANNEINKMFVDESEEVYVRASTLKQIIKNSYLKGFAEGEKKSEKKTSAKIKELEEENEGLKAFESHCDEIEEDAKAIAKENAELKAQIGKMQNVGNCKHAMDCAKFNEKELIYGKLRTCKNCKDWETEE